MNWIRLSSEYPRHRKVLRLVRRLGPASEIYPIRLWLWAVEQSPSGSLRDIEAEELATIVGHAGDPAELWSAMESCGFIEKEDDGWRIRSWYEHQGILMERAEREAARKRRDRAKDVPRTSFATNETNETNETDGRDEEGAGVPALVPSPRKPAEYPLPNVLDVPAFRAAWSDWFAYRSECKLGRWKPRTIEAKLSELAEIGPTRATEAIRRSISNGWHGIFPNRADARTEGRYRGSGKAPSHSVSGATKAALARLSGKGGAA